MEAQGRIVAQTGRVVAVRGSVVDARFRERVPMIGTRIEAGGERPAVLEVLQHLDPATAAVSP